MSTYVNHYHYSVYSLFVGKLGNVFSALPAPVNPGFGPDGVLGRACCMNDIGLGKKIRRLRQGQRCIKCTTSTWSPGFAVGAGRNREAMWISR
jgi:hypothetical protein